MRSILLHVHDDACLEARLQAALDLARSFGGHLTCQQSYPYDLVLPGDVYGDMAARVIPALREDAKKLQGKIEERLSKEDITWDWITAEDPARYSIPRHAVLSDIIVMGTCDASGSRRHSDLAADIALLSSSPVLVVPEGCKEFDVSGPVVVAWNGSDESSKALRAAMPILAKASEVHLLSVKGEGDGVEDLPLTSGASYLARHGIECRITELPVEAQGISHTLADAARARKASCIVMGVYGHSRLRETLLGGVSRSMLNDPPLPLLLMH